jgi:MFS family permease
MRHAHHSKVPIINLEIFQERSFAMGSIVSLAYGVGLYASTYLIPVYMQLALDYNAALAGFALLPSGIVLCLVIPIAGLLADYFNPRAITIIGMALFGLSFILFVIPAAEITYWELVFITIVGRIGLGLIIPALTLAMLGHVRNELLGQGSMIMNYSRQLGGTLGVAVVAVFVEWRIAHYHAQNTDTVQAYLDGFVLIAIIFTLATLVAFKMTPRASATIMDTIHHDQI